MTDRLPRVVFWDNLPAPYSVEAYNAFADRRSFDLSVWFCRRTDPDRSWDVNESEWRFTGTYVEDPSRGLAEAARFAHRCRATSPDLIVSPYGERPFVAGHAIIKALGIRTTFFVQRTFDAWIRRARWKEIAKAILFRSADFAYIHGPDGQRYARRYGFPEDTIFAVRQTTNVEHFARPVSAEERRRHRARVGVHGCVFLYVGRLWKGKGLRFLIEAFRRARLESDAISLLLVGDGVDEHEIRGAARGVNGIVFWPFVQARDLTAYYAASDVFVFPTLGDPWGQVIEEAHAAGLPIITTSAVGEVRQRVVDGTTGFVVPPADTAALAKAMLTLAGDPGLRRSMGERGRERVKMWGHDTYVSEMEHLVSACLTAPRRTTFAARGMSAAGTVVIHTASAAARARKFCQ